MTDFDAILAACPDRVLLAHASTEGGDPEQDVPPERVIVVLAFSEKGFGFGEIVILQQGDEVFLDTECTSLARARKYLNALLDRAITDVDDDPVRHRRYNEVAGRRCSDQCAACAAGRVAP